MRVVIAEDQAAMRDGLAALLGQAGIDVVATAADADALRHEAHAHQPDLVLTDVQMPPTNTDDGLRAALEIRAERPQLSVAVLSQHVQRRYATMLLDGDGDGAGVGYLLKQRLVESDAFCADVRRVGAGGAVIDPEVVALLLARASRERALQDLSPQRREVLALMAEGADDATIGERLSLDGRALAEHAAAIYRELGIAPADDDRRALALLRRLSR